MQHGLEGVLEALAPLRGYFDTLYVQGAHWWRGAEVVKLGQVFGGSGLRTIRLIGSALRGFNTFWKAVPAMVTYLPHLATLVLDNVGTTAAAGSVIYMEAAQCNFLFLGQRLSLTATNPSGVRACHCTHSMEHSPVSQTHC
jgi:hypothetical protein